MASHARSESMLDASWQRVESFDEAGPSRPERQSHDAQGDTSMTDGVFDGSDQGEGLIDGGQGDDGEWHYEDETELITLDLGPESKRLVQMSQEYSITGLDSAHPYLQLGNLMFKGTWDQLIGTEIILHDKRDASRPQGHQHDVWPLPASESDRRHGRPPSTTRRRIILRQAANMAAKEAALVRADDVHPPQLHVHAPVLQENKTGLVTYKGWVWVRGRGWMRKENAAMLQRREGDDGREPVSQDVKTSPSIQARELAQMQVEEEQAIRQAADDDDDDNDAEAAEPDVNDSANEDQRGEHSVNDERDEQQNELPSLDTKQKGVGGRRKMTDEESIRYQLWRAMRKVERLRQGEE